MSSVRVDGIVVLEVYDFIDFIIGEWFFEIVVRVLCYEDWRVI